MSGLKRVMVVEDQALLLLDLVDALADHGIEAVPFTSARNAIQALHDTQVDGLITDIELGAGPSGLQLARTFAHAHPELPIVVVSGGVVPASWELPPTAVFAPKPYRFSQILAGLQPRSVASLAA